MHVEYKALARSCTGKIWRYPIVDDRRMAKVQERSGFSSTILAKILITRGIETDIQIKNFLNPKFINLMPDPSTLTDVDIGITRIISALTNREKICVWGDYDVDGVTSVSMLLRFARTINHKFDFFIPNRQKEGYGLNEQNILDLKRKDISLIIVVDCGTSNVKAVQFAKDHDIDIIIIDHHKVEGVLPKACAFINPHRPGESSELLQQLCSAGLVFLFLIGLNRKLKRIGYYESLDIVEPDLKSYLGLVALATVCDVMSLVNLNRAYVINGIRSFKQDVCLRKLAEFAGLVETINVGHLGYMLGPRINAVGRIGDVSHLSVSFLTSEQEAEIEHYVSELNIINSRRQIIEQESITIAEEILASQDLVKGYICIADTRMHQGVIGIVAGRIKEKYYKPTFIMSIENNIVKGSARSIDGIDIGNVIIKAVSLGILLGGGGHKMAGGFSLIPDQIEAFVQFLDDEIPINKIPERVLTADSVLSLTAANAGFLQELSKLEPFGAGFPTPRFIFTRLLVSQVAVLKDKHIRCMLKDEAGISVQALSFNSVGTSLGDFLLNIKKDKRINVLGALKEEMWKNNKQIKILIDDVAHSE